MTAASRFEVGVIVAKRRLEGPWQSHAWLPHAVTPVAPEAAPWTPLGRNGPDELFYAGPAELLLHTGATAHYRDNLTSARPSLWIELKAAGEDVTLGLVTADPYEGEGIAEVADILDVVPMPPDIAAGVAAFIAAFHVERAFVKRTRNRADPEALARGDPSRPAPDSEDQT